MQDVPLLNRPQGYRMDDWTGVAYCLWGTRKDHCAIQTLGGSTHLGIKKKHLYPVDTGAQSHINRYGIRAQ